MRKSSDNQLLVPELPARVWPETGPLQRSRELTPLYVLRYTGPRLSQACFSHPFWELCIVVRGQGSLRHAPGKDSFCSTNAMLTEDIMGANTVFLIPPDLRHTEHALGVVDTIWIGLKGSRLKTLQDRQLLTAKAAPLVPVAEQLWLLAERQWDRSGAELDALTLQVFTRFMAAVEEAATPDRDCIDLAVEYIQRHFSEHLSVGELAGRFSYSEGYFHRCFRKRTGLTPMQFITRLRINRAMPALRKSTRSVDNIARSVGYSDPLYFTRVFRKHTGMSPSEFRGKGKNMP